MLAQKKYYFNEVIIKFLLKFFSENNFCFKLKFCFQENVHNPVPSPIYHLLQHTNQKHTHMDPYTNYQQQSSSSYDPSQSYNQPTQSYYTTYNNTPQQYPYDNNTPYYIDPNYHPQQYPNDPTSIHPPGVPIQPDPTHLDQHYTHYTQVNAPYVHNLDSSQQWQGTYEAALQTHLVPQVY